MYYGWLSALLRPGPDGAGLCRVWLRERLAGFAAYRARSSAVMVSTTASRMPTVTSSHNESPADAPKTSDITMFLLLDLSPPWSTEDRLCCLTVGHRALTASPRWRSTV